METVIRHRVLAFCVQISPYKTISAWGNSLECIWEIPLNHVIKTTTDQVTRWYHLMNGENSISIKMHIWILRDAIRQLQVEGCSLRYLVCNLIKITSLWRDKEMKTLEKTKSNAQADLKLFILLLSLPVLGLQLCTTTLSMKLPNAGVILNCS